MNWKALGPLLAVILLAALAFAFWPEVPVSPPPAPAQPPVSPPVAEDPPPPRQLRLVRPAGAPGPALIANRELTGAGIPPPPTVAPPQPPGLYKLEPTADPERLRELGIPEDAVEPADAGPLHALDRDGIKGAIGEKLPEIKECYESWLQSNPNLGGKLRVEFQIVEIPGRARGKVQAIEIADGGIGHVAFEGCVRNVFDDLRFEAPKGGEMRVTYPFAFSSTGNENGATP